MRYATWQQCTSKATEIPPWFYIRKAFIESLLETCLLLALVPALCMATLHSNTKECQETKILLPAYSPEQSDPVESLTMAGVLELEGLPSKSRFSMK